MLPHNGQIDHASAQRRTAIALSGMIKPSPFQAWHFGLMTVVLQFGAVVLYAGIIQMLVHWLGR